MDNFTQNHVQGKDKKCTFINRNIPHIQQMTMNDCGVACLKMALM